MRTFRSILFLAVLGIAPKVEAVDFVRGDSNGDGTKNIADAIFTLMFLFNDGAAPPCLDAADINDDGLIDLADPIFSLSTLNSGGIPMIPPPPTFSCGEDPSADSLTCEVYVPCP